MSRILVFTLVSILLTCQGVFAGPAKEPDFNSDDPFEILGVSREDSFPDIEKQMRRLAMKYHPDRLGRQSPELEKECLEKIKSITTAYEKIKTQGADQLVSSESRDETSTFWSSDFWASNFVRDHQRASRARDVQIREKILFDDSVTAIYRRGDDLIFELRNGEFYFLPAGSKLAYGLVFNSASAEVSVGGRSEVVSARLYDPIVKSGMVRFLIRDRKIFIGRDIEFNFDAPLTARGSLLQRLLAERNYMTLPAQRNVKDLNLWTYTVQEFKGVFYVIATLSSEIFTSDMDQELRNPQIRVFIGAKGSLKEYPARYERNRGVILVDEKKLVIPFSNRSKIFASHRALSGTPIIDQLTNKFMGYYDANSEGLQIYNQSGFGQSISQPISVASMVPPENFNFIHHLGDFVLPPVEVVTPVSYEMKRMASRKQLTTSISTTSEPQPGYLSVVPAAGVSTPSIETWFNDYPISTLEYKLAAAIRENEFSTAIKKIKEMVTGGKDDVVLTTYFLRVLRELGSSEYLAQATDLLTQLFMAPEQHGLAAAFARFTLPQYLNDYNQEYFKSLVRSYYLSENSIGTDFLEEYVIEPVSKRDRTWYGTQIKSGVARIKETELRMCVGQLKNKKLPRLK